MQISKNRETTAQIFPIPIYYCCCFLLPRCISDLMKSVKPLALLTKSGYNHWNRFGLLALQMARFAQLFCCCKRMRRVVRDMAFFLEFISLEFDSLQRLRI